MGQRQEIIKLIEQRRVSAIIRADDARLAADAMSAAVAGGFRMVEFTLTTPGALELVAQFSKKPDVIVGAGTVLDPAQAREAVAAGARFIVSPVTDSAVIAEAARLDVVSIPGAFTPTEMLAAHRFGADIIKLFPAPGNVRDFIVAVRGPLPNLRIFPTAGVDAENMVEVLRAGAFGVGFVRALFDPADMAAGNIASIERRAADIIRRLKAMSDRSPK